MRYEYRDVWVRLSDGTLSGCQLSYPHTAYAEDIENMILCVMQFLRGDIPAVTLDPGFRLWNPGKIKEPLDGADAERASAQEAVK